MRSSGSTDAPLTTLVAATHRGMRLALISVAFIVLVLVLSAGSIHFWWYCFLYGVGLVSDSVMLSKQRRIFVLVAPGEVRAWMQVAVVVLGVSGASLLALSAWQIGIHMS